MGNGFSNQPVDQAVKSCPLKEIDIYLYDPEGKPVAGEKIELNKEGEATVQSTTNAKGLAHVVGIAPGKWEVNFPDRGFDEWNRMEGRAEPPRWIDIVLVDAEGNPAAEEPFKVVTLDGATVKEDRLDGSGRARVEVEKPGLYKLNFPERDAKDWWPRPEAE